jgi:hypothetical protein
MSLDLDCYHMYLEDTVYREHSSWHLHCREMSPWDRIGTWQIPCYSGIDQRDKQSISIAFLYQHIAQQDTVLDRSFPFYHRMNREDT